MDLNIRKYIYAFLAFVCVTLSSVSCIFDEYDDVDPSDSGSLQFRIISSVDTKISYPSEYETIFTHGDEVGCVIASKNEEDYTFVENIKWTYKQGDNSGVLMLAENSDKIQAVSDQEKAEQGYVELTDQSMNYAFFFYYPYSDSVNSLSHVVSAFTDQYDADALYASDFIWTNYVLDQRTKTENITSSNANYPVNLTFEKKMAVIDIHCEGDALSDPYIQIGTENVDIGSNTIYTQSGFNISTGEYNFNSNTAVFPTNGQKTGLLTPYLWSGTEEDTEKIYRLNVIPQTFRDWSLVVTLNSSPMAPIPLEDKLTQLEEGKLYILHIAPAGNGSVEIVDWDSGAFGDLVPEDEVEVVGPHVTRIDNASRTNANLSATEIIARPGEQITITGQNLNLIGKLIVHEEEVPVEATDEGKKITFTFPEFADVDSDGLADWVNGDIVMVTGTEYADVAVGTELPAGTYVLPTPKVTEVIREGVDITLKGTDLDLVKTLGMPGNTEAQFTHVSANELRVDMLECKTDPYVYAGDITLTTDYAEPVSTVVPYDEMPQFHSFSTSSLSHGDELVITGRDLDLVNCVIFEDNVDDNVVYTRGTCNGETELHVIVPPGAQTGKVVMRLVYGMIRVETSPTELTVVQPATEDIRIWEDTQGMESDDQLAKEGNDHKVYHTVDSELLANESYKGPESLVHYYDWTDVEEGDVLIICVDKTENWADWNFGIRYLDGDAYGNHIDLYGNPYGYTASPITNTSGVMIRLTSAMIENIKTNGFVIDVPESDDGQKCRVDKILIRKLQINPTVSAVFNFRPGGTTTVNGTNLDKIAYATVPGLGSTTLTINVFNVSADKTSMTFTLPEATCDGTMCFYDAGGNQISSVSFAVENPSFSSFNGQTSVAVGESLTIKGENLDLVKSVTFSGGITVDVTPTDSQTIVVSVPSGAQTGQIMLNMANGTQVPTDSITISEPVVAVPEILNDRREGTDVYFSGTNLDQVRQIYINGNAQAFELVGDEICIAGSAMGINGTARFVYDSGEVSYDFNYSPKITGVTDEKGNAITSADPGQKIIIKGENLDLANLVQFNVSGQYVRVNTALGQTDASLTVTVPAGASGSTYIRLRDIMGGYDDGLGVRDLAVNQLDGNEVDVWNGSIVYSDWNSVNVGDYLIVYVNPTDNFNDWSFSLNSTQYSNSTGVMIQLDQTSLNYLRNNGGFQIGDISPSNCQVSKVTVLKKQVAGGGDAPTVTSINPTTGQINGELQIFGANLDKVVSVTFTGGVTVDASDFITKSTQELKLRIPVGAQTGTLKLNLANGSYVETSTLTITGGGEQIVPTINPPITRYDQLIYVDGTNLKSVTSVYLNDEDNPLSEGVYSVNDAGTRITIDLTKGGQKGVTGFVKVGYDGGTKKENYNFTPTVTSFDKTEVAVGETITITGTNLDLVDKITFVNGDSSCGVTVQVPGETLTFTVPEGAQTGQITLSCIDGGTTTVTPGQTITITSSGGGNQGGSGDDIFDVSGLNHINYTLTTEDLKDCAAGNVLRVTIYMPINQWAHLYIDYGANMDQNNRLTYKEGYSSYNLSEAATYVFEKELTEAECSRLKTDGAYIYLNAGSGVVITQITIARN